MIYLPMLVYVQNVPLCDFAEQSFLRVSFIELAQNFIAIHCDVTMALNVGSTMA